MPPLEPVRARIRRRCCPEAAADFGRFGCRPAKTYRGRANTGRGRPAALPEGWPATGISFMMITQAVDGPERPARAAGLSWPASAGHHRKAVPTTGGEPLHPGPGLVQVRQVLGDVHRQCVQMEPSTAKAVDSDPANAAQTSGKARRARDSSRRQPRFPSMTAPARRTTAGRSASCPGPPEPGGGSKIPRHGSAPRSR